MTKPKMPRSQVSSAKATSASAFANNLDGRGIDSVLLALSQFVEARPDLFRHGLSRLKVEVTLPGGGVARIEMDGPGWPLPGEAGISSGGGLTDEETFASLAKPLSFNEVTKLVEANNMAKNTAVTTELLVSLIWKESGFRPDVKASGSSATGLMQMTKDAVSDVNNNTPSGIHFEHSEMTDPAKNIQCGTYYLDLRIQRAGGKLKEGLENYGTGQGYADNIIDCETCLKKGPKNPQDCLDEIHT